VWKRLDFVAFHVEVLREFAVVLVFCEDFGFAWSRVNGWGFLVFAKARFKLRVCDLFVGGADVG
jgi:hypothetical protein